MSGRSSFAVIKFYPDGSYRRAVNSYFWKLWGLLPREGSITVYELKGLCDVPRPKIYEVLGRLVGLGLAEEVLPELPEVPEYWDAMGNRARHKWRKRNIGQRGVVPKGWRRLV